MEAGLNAGLAPAPYSHPIFDSVRLWLEQLKDFSLQSLNRLADESNIRTEGGKPIRFVAPSRSDAYYEVHLFETGQVQTRPDNKHDLFNALVWLAFPKTKARINAMHAAEIPREQAHDGGRRGRLRDLLTIFDEGGALARRQGQDAPRPASIAGFRLSRVVRGQRSAGVLRRRAVLSSAAAR